MTVMLYNLQIPVSIKQCKFYVCKTCTHSLIYLSKSQRVLCKSKCLEYSRKDAMVVVSVLLSMLGYGTESLLLSCNRSDNLKIAKLTFYLNSRLGQAQNCLKSTLRLTNSSSLAAEVIIRFIHELPKAGYW